MTFDQSPHRCAVNIWPVERMNVWHVLQASSLSHLWQLGLLAIAESMNQATNNKSFNHSIKLINQ